MKKSKLLKYKRHQQYKERKILKRKRILKNCRHKTKHIRSFQVKKVKNMPQNNLAQLIEYDVLFGRVRHPKIEELLSYVPREMTINIAGILTNLYGMAGIDKLDLFFSSKSYHNRRLVRRLLSDYLSTKTPNHQLFWTTAETSKLLLRYAFSIPVDKYKFTTLSEEDAELRLFKVILLMNQECTRYSIQKSERNYPNMLFLLSVMNANMQGHDVHSRKDRSIMQLYFSVRFFLMIDGLPKYKPMLEAFMSEHGLADWNEYIRSVFGIIAMNNFLPFRIPGDLRNDIDHLINKKVIDTIAMPWNETIKFKSDGPVDREGNTDYKGFRNRPLIVLPNGDYVFNSWEFVIDRLFNSLYFEFHQLKNKYKLKVDVNSLFTNTFAEKHLFDLLIGMSASRKKYQLVSEDIMNANYQHKVGELGPPDYLLLNDKCCILFECKDVRIGGDETESHDFDTIIDIFSNKLYQKKWHYIDGVKVYFPTDKDKRIGITQLTDHIKNIRQSDFHYADVNKNIRVYPVLILSDYKNLHRGFNHIAYSWYRESLDSLTTVSDNNRPIIVLSFITLIKYHQLFSKYGFETYFEDYYKVMFSKPFDENSAMDACMTFDDFMGRHPYDLTPIHEELMNVITRGLGNK